MGPSAARVPGPARAGSTAAGRGTAAPAPAAGPAGAPARARSFVRTDELGVALVDARPSDAARRRTAPYGSLGAVRHAAALEPGDAARGASWRSSARSIASSRGRRRPATKSTCPRPGELSRRMSSKCRELASAADERRRRAPPGCRSGPTRRRRRDGLVRPLTESSPSGSSTKVWTRPCAVTGPTAIVPGSASTAACAATFVVSPSATGLRCPVADEPDGGAPVLSPTRTVKPEMPQAASTSRA